MGVPWPLLPAEVLELDLLEVVDAADSVIRARETLNCAGLIRFGYAEYSETTSNKVEQRKPVTVYPFAVNRFTRTSGFEP